jgi:DNA repair protein RadA/Sms
MSKKATASFSCIECGSNYSKWVGKCVACENWNTIREDIPHIITSLGSKALKEAPVLEGLMAEIHLEERIVSGSGELNRVLGGGLVVGSSILIGGEPGVGKSTLLLDLASKLSSKNGRSVVYISGEESVNQIRLRSRRMNLKDASMKLAYSTSLYSILSIIKNLSAGDILIIDSIQTITDETIQSSAGSIAQVRACAHELLAATREKDITLFLVGHINKEGQIAGPKVLEHMVDVVLYFEEDNTHQFRILKNIKNRFGNVEETGIFRMQETGLLEIPNPSALFLSKKDEDKIGRVVFSGIEGTRGIMLEAETLLAPSFMSFPKRAAIGWDANRLSMVIAVLTSHLKLKLHEKEIYLNIAGGQKLNDSSLDLAVAACLFSSHFEIPIKREIAVFGEISLSGEIRPVQFMETRIKEAVKLGHETIFCPPLDSASKSLLKMGNIIELKDIKQLRHLIKA